MKIGKIACLNLERRKTRLISWVSSCYAQQVPLDLLYRFDAKDALEYEYDDLVHAVINDGFPSFEWHFDPSRKEEPQRYKPLLAATWSQLRCLRWISSQQKHVLLMEDDYILVQKFDFFQKIYQLITNPKLTILNKPVGLPYEIAINNQYWTIAFNNQYWTDKIWSGSYANIYSPEGALMVLSDLEQQPYKVVETLVTQYREKEGVHSYIGPELLVTPSIYTGKSDVFENHQSSFKLPTIL